MNLKQEDKLLFDKLTDRMEAARKNNSAAFSDFIDPFRCAAFLQSVKEELYVFGGYENAERVMIGFPPPSEVLEDSDFPISPVSFTYNSKFSSSPGHRDYLGAVTGLGLDRGKIGDIRIAAGGAIIYVQSDIAAYITENLRQAGRTNVKATVGAVFDDITDTVKTKRITVASMRVDAVVGAAFNLSRGKAAVLIDSEKVFVNWKTAKKSQILNAGDTLTTRGYGRIKIGEESGRTKKDRIAVSIFVF